MSRGRVSISVMLPLEDNEVFLSNLLLTMIGSEVSPGTESGVGRPL